jgi:hypothetical protein
MQFLRYYQTITNQFFFNQFKNKTVIPFALGLLAMGSSQSAFAFFNIDAAIGKRQGQFKTENSNSGVTSTTMRAGAHLDPIPLVPVSFGLGLGYDQWKTNKDDTGLTKLSSFSVMPEIKAWIPLGDFIPYGRIGYSILSVYSADVTFKSGGTDISGKIAFAGAGLHLGAGVEYSVPLIPLFYVCAGVEQTQEYLKLTSDKIQDIDISGVYSGMKMSSTAFLLGAKIGF